MPAGATTLARMNLADLASRADKVFRGTVISVKAGSVKAGGGEYHAIPCLNEHPRWIAALSDLAWRNLAGWLTPPPDAKEREMALARAKAMGAKG